MSPCNETQIECNGRCIVQSQLCDDIDDCGDNSDEIDCGKLSYYRIILRDKNFEVFTDFDLLILSKIEISKFCFEIIIGERACTSKIYL